MTSKEQQVIENALNGVGYTDIAAAYDMSDEDVMSLVAFMLQIVREYQATGAGLFFECDTIEQAQANKLKVLHVLAQIRIWDQLQRPVIKLVLQGQPLQNIQEHYPIDKSQVNEWLNAAMVRIAAHLKDGDLAQFNNNRAAWVKANMTKAIDIIDRLTSWTHGRQLKNITFSTISTEIA